MLERWGFVEIEQWHRFNLEYQRASSVLLVSFSRMARSFALCWGVCALYARLNFGLWLVFSSYARLSTLEHDFLLTALFLL